MKLSVIVPVYNAEKYLHRCIDSILNQAFDDFELLLIDDGSNDSSGAICEKYAEFDERVRVIHKNNNGVSEARNTGIDNAVGEYIIFVDSDDEISKGFFDDVAIKAENVDLYICGAREIQKEFGKITNQTEHRLKIEGMTTVKWLFSNVGASIPVCLVRTPWAKAYRTQIIKKNNVRFDKNFSLGEDILFNLSYCEHIEKVYVDINVYYMYYKENQQSLASRYTPNIYENTKKIYDKFRETVHRIVLEESGHENFENLYLSSMVSCISHIYEHKRGRKEKKEIIEKVTNDEWVQKNRGCSGKLKSRIVRYFITRGKKRIVKWMFDLSYALK